MKKYFIFLICVTLMAEMSWAEPNYGTALIEKGYIHLLRKGETQEIKAQAEEVGIEFNDLIKVGPDSEITLHTTEDTDLKLGSHAVFQVKNWTSKGKEGSMKLLFGRTNIKTRGKLKGKRFQMKTASATIGVRGTDFFMDVTPEGNTALITNESIVEMEGNKGEMQEVGAGQMSVVVNGKPATPPVDIPQDAQESMNKDGIHAPPPGSPQASNLIGQQGLIAMGLIKPEDLDQSKNRKIGANEKMPGQEFKFEPPKIDINLEEAKNKALKKWKVEASFEK